MEGVFAEWQPRYAAQGIATFPVNGKLPAVRNYLRIGLSASRLLCTRFGNAEGLGLACRPNGLTVLDVDSSDERILEEAFAEFGPSPFIVRSGSGHFQAWYRHNGERRWIRPDRAKPIDILGDGFVVAPPSRSNSGKYEIIRGSLDDLASLPTLVRSVPDESENIPGWQPPGKKVEEGRRNAELWLACMRKAHGCLNIDELKRYACAMNTSECAVPLSESEVARLVAGVWKKTQSGENWIGQGRRVVFRFEDVDRLLPDNPDAFAVLGLLKRHHGPDDRFVVANAMAPSVGLSLRRFVAARSHLERLGVLELIRPPSARIGPALYRFKGARN